jgi:hypothetical protein
MWIVCLALDLPYTFIAQALMILFVRSVGLMRVSSPIKVRKEDRKPWNTAS